MKRFLLFLILISIIAWKAKAQCGGIMEPGFAFLTSSRGCAPFTVNIQTIYLSSVPGTQYFVDWGDGTPEQTYTQVGAGGVVMSHNYPLASINCGYDVVIDASNACNPRGSVVPITTQVIVWTNDVVSAGPAVYRVCAGYAASVQFTDNSTWNCFPRATRENNEPRWIQWQYGTGPAANQIPGVTVNGITPGGFPYLDPAPLKNPIYPVLSPGLQSLPIQVPAAPPADIGKEFEINLKNWNQCNPYDNNTLDGNGLNPVSGDLINGDNPAQQAQARIVIVPSPQANFLTRLGGPGGPVQTVFCIDDPIYFDNQTPPIGGASFQYTWSFFDNSTGAGAPLGTSGNTNPTFAYPAPGQKLIRLAVRDQNAAGNCVSSFDFVVTISPSLLADIRVTDFADVAITPDFCQAAVAPFTTFQVRFTDASVGSVTPTTQWRWEFYDQNNSLIQESPLGGGFSATPPGPFDMNYVNKGVYRVRLRIRDNATSCESVDDVQVRVFENPVPLFSASRVCQGQASLFNEASTLQPTVGESIALREWDFNYDGVTFTKDPAFDNQSSFTRNLGPGGTYQVALRVTTSISGCVAMVVHPVTVDPLPLAAFSPDVTSGCSNLTVNFTNNAVVGQPDVISQFIWEVDDGTGYQVAGIQDPGAPGFTPVFTWVFSNTGLVNKPFDFRLRAVTVHGCMTTAAATTITVFPGTSSGFSSTNYSPFNDNCSPVGVNFQVDPQTQSLNPTNYRWRVSDLSGVISDVSTGTVPQYNYNFINSDLLIHDFNVTLTTTLPGGCFGDSTRIIRVSPVPVSLFKIDTLIFDCQKMRVRAESSQKGLQYHWQVMENSVVMVNYTGPDDFVEYEVTRAALDINLAVSLDTRNFANCVSNINTQSVVVPKRDAINASFTATPALQSLPSSTVFITNTTLPGPWTFLWDFGDGTNSTSNAGTLQHVYATYGTYVITLTVRNNVCLETVAQSIIIQAVPPIVDFSFDPPSGCAPLTVHFTNLSQFAEPDTYQWRFGDGQASSNAIHPTYTYYEPGTYTVSLSASNITGQVVTAAKQQIIQVFAKPSAQFEIKPKLIYIPGGLLYTKNNSFDAGTFLWDFGDGGTSDLPEPQHEYTAEGDYTITLIAVSPSQCTDTARVTNAVKVQRGGQLLVPNAFSPNLNGGGTAPGSGGSSDGKNDIFLPLMKGVTQFEMLVFNRWGELLFESRDPQVGWDGYYHGKLCPQDVYVYKVTAQYDNGERVVRTGDINLIR